MVAISARDKLYRDIVDFLFISVMSGTSFDDMIDEDPERFEEFRVAIVNAVKNPYNDHLTALDHYLLGDVRYRRFFIQMQEDLDHVLEIIPIEVTVVVCILAELRYDLRSRLVAWVVPELSRGPPLDEPPYEKPRFFELH